MSLKIVFATFIFLFTVAAESSTCKDFLFNIYDEEEEIFVDGVRYSLDRDIDYYGIHFRFPYGFHAYLESGALRIIAQLKSSVEIGKRLNISGSQIYRDMIAHFGVENIRLIRGDWRSVSDNFKQFQLFLNEGFSNEEAALKTWSGKRASEFGFSKVRVLKSDEEGVHVEFFRDNSDR